MTRTSAHYAVLAVLAALPTDIDADAALIGQLFGISERQALRLLVELEAIGDLTTAVGPRQ